MNSFTFVGIGNLARNPEILTKGEVSYARFCLVGADYAEPDDGAGHSREVFNSVWFFAFNEIADRIAIYARKGDQLIVTARIRSYGWIDREGESCNGTVFIVTGFRFGARGGPGFPANSTRTPKPQSPVEPVAAVAGSSSRRDVQHAS
jgi:single-stranded DNA-binding protein